MEKERKSDRRILRSKSAIRNAYLLLLGQMDSSEITVTDIADHADVDRKTIYNYYEGIDAIRNELENELVLKISSSLEQTGFSGFLQDPKTFLESVHGAFTTYRDLTIPLFRMNNGTSVFQKLRDSLSSRYQAFLMKTISPGMQKYSRIYADFLMNGMISVYQEWIQGGMQLSLEEVAKLFLPILSSGSASFLA